MLNTFKRSTAERVPRCGYAPTFDNINVCRAAWIINGYYISGLMNWAQHSDSKTLVKSKIQLLELK